MSLIRVNAIQAQAGSVVRFEINGGVSLPSGTTSTRPTGVPAGTIRFNSETGRFEGWNGSAWQNLAFEAP